MNFSIGDIVYFKPTYSLKHKSCEICQIVKLLDNNEQYLVVVQDIYAPCHYYRSIVNKSDLDYIANTFVLDLVTLEDLRLKMSLREVMKLPFHDLYSSNTEWTEFLNSGYDTFLVFKNNQIKFRKPHIEDKRELESFKKEFQENHSGMDGTGVLNECDVEEWLLTNKVMETTENPQYYKYLQYGLFRNNRLLGLIQIRLELKGYLTEFGGHIGYCVRPSERRKGYAKTMLQKALEVCKEIGLTKVLITCLENNVASAKTIEACGGVFEKLIYDDKNYQANLKRYWITLK